MVDRATSDSMLSDERGMMRGNGWPELKHLHYFHELLFSLSMGYLGVSLMFLAAPSLRIPFGRLEVEINRFLHIRQTDLMRGYWEYAISSTILALCMFIALRLSSDTRLTKEILRSISGILLLLAPPIFWICLYQVVGWPYGWPYRWAPFELMIIITWFALFVGNKWRFPFWINITVLMGHYIFWYFAPSTNPELADYSGPIAPVLGFCSAMAWLVYAERWSPIPE